MTNRRDLLKLSVGAFTALELANGQSPDNIELGALRLMIRTHNKTRLGQATVSDYAAASTALGFAALRWEASGTSAIIDARIRRAVADHPDQILSPDTLTFLHKQLVSLGSAATMSELASALQLRETDRRGALAFLSSPNPLEKVVESAGPRLKTLSQSAVPAQGAICDDCAWYGGWLLTFASAIATTLDLLAGGSLLSAANILTILSIACLLLG